MQVKPQDGSRQVQRRNWTSTSIRKDVKKVQPKVEVARRNLEDGNEGEIKDGLRILHEEFDSLNRSVLEVPLHTVIMTKNMQSMWSGNSIVSINFVTFTHR